MEPKETQKTEPQSSPVLVTLRVLEKLPTNAKLADVIAKVNELIEVTRRSSGGRDRGPRSTRNMTSEDARRLTVGDLAKVNHTDAAEILGLSYGQVYSCRKGYTFKNEYKASPKVW